MRSIKLALATALTLLSLSAGTSLFTGTAYANQAQHGFCTNTGCDFPGQSACPFLENANCGNSAGGCQGWVSCDAP
jgi:hypothetical protein